MNFSKEAKIGTAGVVALVLLFFTIKFLQGVSLFSSSDTYYINFDNAKALAKSSPVYADGYNVGIVSNIIYDYEHPGNGVIVEISVEKGMRIPDGTVAVLDEAMLGGCTLNLMMGNNPSKRYEVGDTIPSVQNNGLMARAADMIPKLEVTLAKVDTLLTTLNALASDSNLVAILQNANTVTANASQLTADLGQSARKLDGLLANDIPQMAQTFNRVGQNVESLTNKLNQIDLQTTMNKVDATMANVQALTNQLSSKDNNVGLLLNDTSVYYNLNRTTQGAAELLEDMKANPKRYVHFSVFGKKDKAAK